MLVKSGLCKSQSDARKQIEQNAVSVNDRKISDPASVLTAEDVGKDGAMLKKGKKGCIMANDRELNCKEN